MVIIIFSLEAEEIVVNERLGSVIICLDECIVTVSISVCLEVDVSCYACVVNARECSKNVSRLCAACSLDSFESYIVCIVAESCNCGELIVSAVVFEVVLVSVDLALEAAFEFSVCTFSIECGAVDLRSFACLSSSVGNDSAVPGIACYERYVVSHGSSLSDDLLSITD